MIHLVAAGSLRPFLKFKVSREQLPSCLPSSLVLQHTPNPSTETQQFQCSTCPLAQSVLSPEGTTRCSKLEKLGYDTAIFLISSFRAMAIAYYPVIPTRQEASGKGVIADSPKKLLLLASLRVGNSWHLSISQNNLCLPLSSWSVPVSRQYADLSVNMLICLHTLSAASLLLQLLQEASI